MTDKTDKTDKKDKPQEKVDEAAVEVTEESTGVPEEDTGRADVAPEPLEVAAVETDEVPETPERVDSEQKPVTRKGGGGWLTGVLMLLLLGAVAALGYFGWEREQALQARIDELDSALGDQRSAVSGVRQQAQSAAAEAQSATQQSRRQLEQMQDKLQSTLTAQRRDLEAQLQTLHQQVRSLSTTTTEDWKLAEAYYLMRLAAQRLLMERDTGSALALLEGADEIVRNYPDADLHAVRSALAEDMATLRLANNVDLQGIYLRIAALGRNAQSLPIHETLTFSREEDEAEAQPEAEQEAEATDIWSTIRRSFQAMVEKLQDYIRISHDQDELDSLMRGPAAADQLLSSLLLNLDTAQLALLREQPEIYQHSLDRALQLTSRLVPNSQQRQRFIAELEALRDTDIIQDLPSIGASQQAMAVYLERRHRLAPRNTGRTNNGAAEEAGSSQP